MDVDELFQSEWQTPPQGDSQAAPQFKARQPRRGRQASQDRPGWRPDVLAVILEGVDDGITAQAADGTLIYANKNAAAILGFGSVEELVSTPGEEFTRRFELFDEAGKPIPDDSRPGRLGLHGEQQPPTVFRIVDKVAGKERWSIVKSIPVRDERGEVQFAVNIFSDITKRKQAEDARHLSEELFAKAFRVSPAALWISDLETGTAIDVNDNFLHMTGYSRDEAIGKTTLALGLWAHHEARDLLVKMLRQQGFVRDFDFKFRKSSGELRDGVLSAEVIDIHGKPCLLINCIDITERNRVAEELKQYAGRAATMHALDRAILQSRSVEAIAREALRSVSQLVPCSRADVLLLDDQANIATILATECQDNNTKWVAGTRISLEGMRFPDDYRAGKAVLVDDLAALDEITPPLRAALDEGLRSCISVPLVSMGELIGALSICAARPWMYTPTHVEIGYEVAYELTIGIQNARLLEEVRAGREELQNLSRRLLEIQENERYHIARELHDEIGQVLTAVQMNIEALRRSPEGSGIGERLDESSSLVDQALQEVRNLSLDLRPSLLDDLGLVSALVWYAERQSERSGIDVQFAFDPLNARLRPDIETACFRIAQEAITNINRHAGASHVRVELHRRDRELELAIYDNGAGFDVRAARESASRGSSMGLLSMQERAELAGGRLAIESRAGQGSVVRALLPVDPAQQASEGTAE